MENQLQSSHALALNGPSMGRPKVITDEYVFALKELVRHTPKVYGYPFKRWTASWLRCHLAKELGIEVSDRHINRLLKQMGLSKHPIRAVPSQDNCSESPKFGCIAIQDLDPSTAPEFNWPLN